MTRLSIFDAKRDKRTMTLLLGGAVIAAVAFALGHETAHSNRDQDARLEDLVPETARTAPAEAPTDPDGATLGGEVLETVPVSKYTYLRLRSAGGEVWAAVPSASIAVGSRVAIANAARMDDFKSTTLKRTFKVIYFGNLASPSTVAPAAKFSPADVPELDDDQALPPGHPDIGGAQPLAPIASDEDTLPPGHPDIGATSAPSLLGGAAEPTLPAVSPIASHDARPIDPARGENAHVISELNAQRQKLAGRRVRVRGEVTKVTPDVQGRAFFHLRDGDPDRAGQQTDLVVTSKVPPQRGQIGTFEGTLRADVDVGVGYKYPVLLEDATLLEQ